ncbi:MAG TPA: HipA family kinase [Candidatus Methylomirabilis sp.]|nr:HipA family kinase [Candidatus Methylomirabilis sp.]
MIARHAATRYVQPLREGGSLPAVVDTDGGGLFVVKFRGAGQGAKALIAELVVGRLAQAVDLPVPELAIVDLSSAFGRSEPDPEIQDILRGSHGVNVGLRYLDGAFNFDAGAAAELITSELATRLVWFDALVTNPDRTHRNPNLLVWRRTPWLIDHGGALYAHHDWAAVDEARARTAFPLIRDHVLLDRAGDVLGIDAAMAAALDGDTVARVLAEVPDELLTDPVGCREFGSAEAARARYRDYLTARLRSPRDFAAQAARAREERGREPGQRLSARR